MVIYPQVIEHISILQRGNFVSAEAIIGIVSACFCNVVEVFFGGANLGRQDLWQSAALQRISVLGVGQSLAIWHLWWPSQRCWALQWPSTSFFISLGPALGNLLGEWGQAGRPWKAFGRSGAWIYGCNMDRAPSEHLSAGCSGSALAVVLNSSKRLGKQPKDPLSWFYPLLGGSSRRSDSWQILPSWSDWEG